MFSVLDPIGLGSRGAPGGTLEGEQLSVRQTEEPVHTLIMRKCLLCSRDTTLKYPPPAQPGLK